MFLTLNRYINLYQLTKDYCFFFHNSFTVKLFSLLNSISGTKPAISPSRFSRVSLPLSAIGLKNRTRKKKANGAPNGFYGEIDWDRYASPDVDEEGFSLRPGDDGKQFFSSSDSEDDEDSRKKFKIRIKPLVADSAKCVPPSMDELKASAGGLALSPSLVRTADQYSCSTAQHWRTHTDTHTHTHTHTLSLHVCLISCLYICLFLSPICPSSTPSSPCLSPGPPPDEPPPSPPPSFSPGSPHPFTPLDSPPSFVLGHPPPDQPFVAPISPVPPLPAERRSPRAGVTSPLVLGGVGGKRTPEGVYLRDEVPDFSPRELTPSFRGTPPPLPPTTYRSIMSSPGPYSGSSEYSVSLNVYTKHDPSGVFALRSAPPGRRALPPSPPLPCRHQLVRHLSFLLTSRSASVISSRSCPSPWFSPHVAAHLEASQPLVWFDHGRFHLAFEGCSRGPSPLTMGPQDTLPVAAAFTETINAYFKGADPSKCAVKVTGEMVLSFPAGITRHFSSHPTQPVLTFSISNYNRLEQVLPNPQLLCCDPTTEIVDTKDFWVNMPNLMSHLKKVAEQKPQATYYNVDMIKYQVSAEGIQSTPLNLAVSWRGDATNTDLRIDYKYNAEAMAAPTPLHDIRFLVPVDGGEAKLQAMIPPATWNPEQQTIQWKIPSLSHRSENGGVGALLGRFQMTGGSCRPSQLVVQFTSEGSTLSGCDIQLVGTGYRLSLIKKRFAAGQFEYQRCVCVCHHGG
uniref:MHD domain-containing protein n=1 Tax=Mola mola TaxID=94237 RepID=A0A3Q4A9A4_MOLML